MGNVLNEAKKQQVIALGRLGWSLRRIQRSTGVRRETAATYLRGVGIALRAPGAWGRAAPANPANEVATDSAPPKSGNGISAALLPAKPANEVTTDFGVELATLPGRSPSASACEVHREAIELALSQGRNAVAIWQDLVDLHGFRGAYGSVKRFVRGLRGKQSPEACAVIETAPGEDYGESGVMVRTASPVARPSAPGSRFCRSELPITQTIENIGIPPPVSIRKGIHDVFELVFR